MWFVKNVLWAWEILWLVWYHKCFFFFFFFFFFALAAENGAEEAVSVLTRSCGFNPEPVVSSTHKLHLPNVVSQDVVVLSTVMNMWQLLFNTLMCKIGIALKCVKPLTAEEAARYLMHSFGGRVALWVMLGVRFWGVVHWPLLKRCWKINTAEPNGSLLLCLRFLVFQNLASTLPTMQLSHCMISVETVLSDYKFLRPVYPSPLSLPADCLYSEIWQEQNTWWLSGQSCSTLTFPNEDYSANLWLLFCLLD